MPKINHPKCPFFRRQNADSITCEGAVGVSAVQVFGRKEAKDKWRREYCGDFGFKLCPHYKGLMNTKYEGD